MFNIDEPQCPEELLVEPAFLIIQGCASNRGDAIGSIYNLAFCIFLDETLIAALLDIRCNLV